MNNSYNNINIEKLKGTLVSLKSLNASLENNNISNIFTDIDNYLQKINFEHGNCIYNFRSEINAIEDKMNVLKENTHSLENALNITVSEFQSVEHREVNAAGTINNSTTVTQIPPETSNQGESVQETSNEINTIPIGLGIGAAGIAGSVGAVVVNNMNEKNNYHNTKEDSVEIEEYKNNDNLEENKKEVVFDDSPYHASRSNQEKNKFYGTNITEYYEKEDNEEKNDY